MSLKNKIFGADVPLWLKQKISIRQSFSRSHDFGEAVTAIEEKYTKGIGPGLHTYPVNFWAGEEHDSNVIADLSSRTPFARMWTALSVYEGIEKELKDTPEKIDKWHSDKYEAMAGSNKQEKQKWLNKFLKDRGNGTFQEYEWSQENLQEGFQRIYIIGNHVLNTLEKGPNSRISSDVGKLSGDLIRNILPFEQESNMNQFLKPPAGITSISTQTEGRMGAQIRTTVNFVVHNFSDFEKIYLRYFLKPGAQIFLDFGWDTSSLYAPEELLDSTNIEDFLYGDMGVIVRSGGDMETFFGNVANYDASVREDGGFDCSVEIVSKNTALFGIKISKKESKRISANLETDILGMAVAGLTGDTELYLNAVRAKDYEDAFKDVSVDLFLLAEKLFGSQSGNTFRLPGEETFNAETRIETAGEKNLPAKLSLEHGIFLHKTTKGEKTIYVNWGWFEDNILNKEFGFSDDVDSLKNLTADAASTDEGKLYAKYNSRNSFTIYDKSLVNNMRNMTEKSDVLPFIYPANWGDKGFITYNIKRNMVPDRFDDGGQRELADWNIDNSKYKTFQEHDIENGQIPLREIFITADLIKSSLGSATGPTMFLKKIMKAISKASNESIDLGITSNNYGNHTISITDANTIIRGINQPEDEFLDNLLEFNPYSPNTIVKEYDLSFTMPQGALGNSIAIRNMGDYNVHSVDKMIQSLIELEKLERRDPQFKDGLKHIYVKTLPSIGAESGIRLQNKMNTSDADKSSNSADDLVFEDVGSSGGNTNINALPTSYTDYIKDRSVSIANRMQQADIQRKKKQAPKYKNEQEWSLRRDYEGVYSLTRGVAKQAFDPNSLKRSKELNYILCDDISEYKNVLSTNTLFKKKPSIIGLQLSLKIYGTAGFSPGDLIRVNYLPQVYYENVYFQIREVNHELGESWDTAIKVDMKIYPDKSDAGKSSTKKEIRIKKSFLAGGAGTFQLPMISELLPYVGDLIPMDLGNDIVPMGMNLFETTAIANMPSSFHLPPQTFKSEEYEEDIFKERVKSANDVVTNLGAGLSTVTMEYKEEVNQLLFLGKMMDIVSLYNVFMSNIGSFSKGDKIYILTKRFGGVHNQYNYLVLPFNPYSDLANFTMLLGIMGERPPIIESLEIKDDPLEVESGVEITAYTYEHLSSNVMNPDSYTLSTIPIINQDTGEPFKGLDGKDKKFELKIFSHPASTLSTNLLGPDMIIDGNNVKIEKKEESGGLFGWLFGGSNEKDKKKEKPPTKVEPKNAPKKKRRTYGCFVAGTKVTMHDNTKKNIEDVIVGDKVVSWNEETGKLGEASVIELIQPVHDDMLVLEWDHSTIESTFDHPYWSTTKNSWVSYKPDLTLNRYNFDKVQQLELGTPYDNFRDVGLFLRGDKLIESRLLSIKENWGKVQTYIFKLDNDNTFFANGILVHNK